MKISSSYAVAGVVGVLVGLMLPVLAAGAAPTDSFLRSEYEVMGASASNTAAGVLAADREPQRDRSGRKSEFDVGGDEDHESQGGDRQLGRKVKATLLSAVLPGAGQWYNGDRNKAYWMGGIEVGIWGAFLVFDHQGDSWKDSATDYAGIYAGTEGEHNDAYWITVGSFSDSDRYDDSRRREARALQEPYPDPTSAADSWQWVNDQRRQEFWRLWGDAHDSYDRRDYMYIAALINRVVSMVDAALGVDRVDGSLETSVLGLDMRLAVDPGLREPRARWSFARSF